MNHLAVVFLLGFVTFTYGEECKVTGSVAQISVPKTSKNVDSLLTIDNTCKVLADSSSNTDYLLVDLNSEQTIKSVTLTTKFADGFTATLLSSSGSELDSGSASYKGTNSDETTTLTFDMGKVDKVRVDFVYGDTSEIGVKKLIIKYSC